MAGGPLYPYLKNFPKKKEAVILTMLASRILGWLHWIAPSGAFFVYTACMLFQERFPLTTAKLYAEYGVTAQDKVQDSLSPVNALREDLGLPLASHANTDLQE